VIITHVIDDFGQQISGNKMHKYRMQSCRMDPIECGKTVIDSRLYVIQSLMSLIEVMIFVDVDSRLFIISVVRRNSLYPLSLKKRGKG
jgi:hypothetical protein